MPQHAKGPRLYRRKDTGIYIIRDTGRGERSTGTRDRREAEKELARYIAERDSPSGPASAEQMTVSRALDIYGSEHAPFVRDPARIAYALVPLVKFWGDLPLSAVKKETCRAYGRARTIVTKRDPETQEAVETRPISDGTLRKELSVLSAAVQYCESEGYLLKAPKVHMPPKPAPKDRWLTRDEAAALLKAAYRNPEARHLARFILVALYTGTRKTAVLRVNPGARRVHLPE